MIIVTNHVYDFTFKSALNKWNGIYRVNAILSYAEMVSLNLDLFTLTYQPNSLTEDNFNTDLDQIRTGKIVKLISVTDETVIHYVPEHLFDLVPDGSVQQYYRLGLAVNLGVFDDPEQLNVIKTEVEQVVNSMLGVTDSVVIYTVNSAWMTTAEYKTLEDARKAAVTRVRNHYTDKLDLIRQIDSLKTLINYYEDALKSHTA